MSHLFARTLVACVSAGALATPPGIARPIDDAPAPVVHEGAATVAVEPEPARAAAPTVVSPIESGFDWGSAAVGAGGTGALLVLLSLGAVLYAGRDRIETKEET